MEHNKVTFRISVSHQPIELLSTNAGEMRTNRAATRPDIVAQAGVVSLGAKQDVLKRIIERRKTGIASKSPRKGGRRMALHSKGFPVMELTRARVRDKNGTVVGFS